ncbi:MAG: 3-methyladenine DNA glycosylase [Actinomycetota bacterium]|nr:3-methyladenine DNA glycosylase [Actinomycetota bacterium]
MQPASPSASAVALAPAEWRARRERHEARVDGWTAGYLSRASRREKHPVDDFLFTYYSHSPGRLRRWSPGPAVVLIDHPADTPFVAVDGGAVLGPVPERVRRTGAFVADLLRRTAERAPQLGCFGLHEWAMVYRGERRHEDFPLRLGQQETDGVVDALGLRCSHHDAFRFFTPSAGPLNLLQPTREAQVDIEQPGCLHANMDLYKWSYKLSPFVPSELVADCFDLARRIRALDMQASPYDLSDLGVAPVRVETAEGRAAYAKAQAAFAEEAAVLRARVLEAVQRLVEHVPVIVPAWGATSAAPSS